MKVISSDNFYPPFLYFSKSSTFIKPSDEYIIMGIGKNILLIAIILFSSFIVTAIQNDAGNRIDFSYPTATINNNTISVNNSYLLQGLTPQQVADLYLENDPIYSAWASSFAYDYNQTTPAIN